MKPRNRPIWSLTALIAVLAMVAAACTGGEAVDVGETTTTAAPADTGGDDGDTGDGEPSDTTEPDDTGDDRAGGTLIAAQGAEPDRLDPHLGFRQLSGSRERIRHTRATRGRPDDGARTRGELGDIG